MSLNILLVSDSMIKERTSIHGNIDPKLIYPDIKVAQDMYIEPLLGSALYNKLQGLINTNTIGDAENSNYKLLLDKFIADCLMYYTLTDLPTTISYQFWNKGVMRRTSETADLPSMGELIDISNKYKQRAEFYAKRLQEYLRQNAPTLYKEYINPGSGVDTVRPGGTTYSVPVYLGGRCDNDHRTYEEKYQGNNPNCC